MKDAYRIALGVGVLAALALLLRPGRAQDGAAAPAAPTRVAVCDVAQVVNHCESVRAASEQMTQRLDQDHANARRLAEGLLQIEGFHLNLDKVQTNMVFYSVDESLPLDAYQLAEAVKQSHNVMLGATGPRTFRSVTHYWITAERVDIALDGIRQALEGAA